MQRSCMLDWVLLVCGGLSTESLLMWRYESCGISITYLRIAVLKPFVMGELFRS